MWRAEWVLLAALTAPVSAQTVILYSRVNSDEAQRAQQFAEALVGRAQIDRQLAPGVPWRAAIERWICGADRVLLLWSEHAAVSAEVRREIDTALWCHVPLVPVLLDNTPLPGRVADTQAIDWRPRRVD